MTKKSNIIEDAPSWMCETRQETKWKIATSNETIAEYKIPSGYELDGIAMVVKDEHGKEIEMELEEGKHYFKIKE